MRTIQLTTMLCFALLMSGAHAEESREAEKDKNKQDKHAPAQKPLPEPSKRVKDFLGADTVQILRHAEKVGCYRIRSSKIVNAEKHIQEYPILNQGKDQGGDFARKLAGMLLSDGSYDFEAAKACKFSPGVVFRVYQGKRYTDVILCFTCNELQIHADKENQKGLALHEDFDPIRADLVKLTKKAFPKDEVVQGIPEKKGG